MNGIRVRTTHGRTTDHFNGGHAIAQAWIESEKQWFNIGANPVGSGINMLIFEMSRERVLCNGTSYAHTIGSSGGCSGYYHDNNNGRGVRFQIYAHQTTNTKTVIRNISEGDPTWIGAIPRKYVGDVLLQAERMKSEVTGNWKVETPDPFFYIGEGTYAYCQKGEIGNTATFEAPVRIGRFKFTEMFFTNLEHGIYDVSINGAPSQRVDFYSPTLIQKKFDLGVTAITEWKLNIKFTLVGTNPRAINMDTHGGRNEPGGKLSFDQIRLEPIK